MACGPAGKSDPGADSLPRGVLGVCLAGQCSAFPDIPESCSVAGPGNRGAIELHIP